MLHPSETAVDYIWERFSQSLIPEPSRRLAARIKKVTDAAAHRPLNPGSPGHAAFIRSVSEEIERLEKECPFLDFSAERECLG